MDRLALAAEALVTALRIRKRFGIPVYRPICALDLAESVGLDVRLVNFPSMEGMYVGGPPPRIFLSTLRPFGRRNFTCSHELGHHVFGHGEQFDELVIDKRKRRDSNPNEYSANSFASFLLMPKSAIDHALRCRSIIYEQLAPEAIYYLANWFGVGYTTLVTHLRYGLDVIGHQHFQVLLRSKPIDIRSSLLGRSESSPLFVADQYWKDKAIDIEVGDLLLLPFGTRCEGAGISQMNPTAKGFIFRAETPGLCRVENSPLAWSAFVRVSKHEYVGRACFRFEPEIIE